ncbi:MAG: AAA family ATPase, partial [Firmicutes bacterium]|nr:AAA family ATPase [Bacillota bacterium]
MLIQFRFKNFKSFRDDTIFDMSATKITEFSDRVFRVGNERILHAAAIYGANASGKSNVIEAFSFMTTYVIESFSFGGDTDGKKDKRRYLKRTPFLFDSQSKINES